MPYDAYVRRLEEARRMTVDGVEYWMARVVQPLLGYEIWRNFEGVVGRARAACESAGHDPSQHFAEVGNVITAGHGAQLERADWYLQFGWERWIHNQGTRTVIEAGMSLAAGLACWPGIFSDVWSTTNLLLATAIVLSGVMAVGSRPVLRCDGCAHTVGAS
jgi:hypothetical protein